MTEITISCKFLLCSAVSGAGNNELFTSVDLLLSPDSCQLLTQREVPLVSYTNTRFSPHDLGWPTQIPTFIGFSISSVTSIILPGYISQYLQDIMLGSNPRTLREVR